MSSVYDFRPTVQPVTLREALAPIPDAQLTGADDSAWETPVSGVTVNNRDLAPGWIFVAVPGETYHGIRFAAAAVRNGAAAIVTDEQGAEKAREQGITAPVVIIADPRAASGYIAAAVYRTAEHQLLTMAVTGTNGKTTTSYLMHAALSAKYANPALSGTVYTGVGEIEYSSSQTSVEAPVAHRILAYAAEQNLGAAVLETSSHAMELSRTNGIVFDVAGFTNLSHDHLDLHGDMERYFAAKALLFTPEYARQGVICVDDEWGERLAREATIPVTTVSSYSGKAADWRVTKVTQDKEIKRTVLAITDPAGNTHTVKMPVLGDYNVQNTALAVASAVVAGIDVTAAIKGIENCQQVPGRLQMVNPEPGNQPLVISDGAHTPDSLIATLQTVKALTPGRLVLLSGADGDRDPTKRVPLGEIGATYADVLFVTDENPHTEDAASIRKKVLEGIANVRPGLENVTEITSCRRDAIRIAIFAAEAGDTVVLPGKGGEWYQDIGGVKHVHDDVAIAREVLDQDPRASM